MVPGSIAGGRILCDALQHIDFGTSSRWHSAGLLSFVPTQGALVLEFHAAPRKSDTSINNANAAQLASTSLFSIYYSSLCLSTSPTLAARWQHGYIAQWLERLTADQQVPGSNPGVPSS